MSLQFKQLSEANKQLLKNDTGNVEVMIKDLIDSIKAQADSISNKAYIGEKLATIVIHCDMIAGFNNICLGCEVKKKFNSYDKNVQL